MKNKTLVSGRFGNAAFTLVELITIMAVLALLSAMLLPALARTRTNGGQMQCRNNSKQLAAGWAMYATENNGRLVSAYPNYAGFTATWCAGNAASSGSAGVNTYGGADPAGITNGLLWAYIREISAYRCTSDLRIATTGAVEFIGQPILRSVSMNSFMAGTSFGVSPTYSPFSPQRNPLTPVLLHQDEIRKPAQTWVITEEDPMSINDGMFTMDMGGTRGFIDFPSRLHNNGYVINFADGHVENIRLIEWSSLTAKVGSFINDDWRRLTNITTHALQ
jgi:prepilin-type processing-associated H-X9-DG protein